MSKKKFETDGLVFKSRDDLNIYLELSEAEKDGLIESFSVNGILEFDPDKSKYNAKSIIINGNKMDSKLEARYYLYLLREKKAGKVKDFSLKPKFNLLPTFKKDGRTFRGINYIADFEVIFPDGTKEIVDTKGVVTTDFVIKEKMFNNMYPDLPLRVVKFAKWCGGWVEHHIWERKSREKKKALKK